MPDPRVQWIHRSCRDCEFENVQCAAAPEPPTAPIPIATSGDVSILPPSTGLPVATSAPARPSETATHEHELETETLHG